VLPCGAAFGAQRRARRQQANECIDHTFGGVSKACEALHPRSRALGGILSVASGIFWEVAFLQGSCPPVSSWTYG
jgi:hypothetical protein